MLWSVAAVCALSLAAWVRNEMRNESRKEDARREQADALQCSERTWIMISPSGEEERVAQRFVKPSVTEKGYRFPSAAGRMFVADRYGSDCEVSGSVPIGSAIQFFERGYKFRGYRESTDEERREDELKHKYGAPDE